jgi:DHA1 family bicyclomycin/chloramphenicol resistance-like MFS transporter
MIAGLLLYEVATLGCVFAGDMTSLLVWRAIQGLGAGAGSVLARAVIRDLFEGAQMARMLSLALAAFITAPIIAPSLGAAILSVASWRWIFGFLALYGALLILAAILFLEESLKSRSREPLSPRRLLAAYAAPFLDPASRSWAAVTTLIFGTLTVYLTNAPAVLMQTYGLGPTAFGAAFAVIAICSSAGNVLNARLVRRNPLSRTIRMALLAAIALLAATVGLAAGDVGGIWVLLGGLALFFITFGMVAANSTTLALQPHKDAAGSASAALGFAQTALPAAVASIVAASYDGTALPMTLAMLVLAILAGITAMAAS